MAYERTKVKARNPERGVYRTLDGSHEIRQADKKGCWDLFRLLDGGAQKIASEVRGYDAALNRALEQGEFTLEQLNARPAKQTADARTQSAQGPAGPTPAVEAKPKRSRRQPATA